MNLSIRKIASILFLTVAVNAPLYAEDQASLDAAIQKCEEQAQTMADPDAYAQKCIDDAYNQYGQSEQMEGSSQPDEQQ